MTLSEEKMRDRFDENRDSAIQIGNKLGYSLIRYYPEWTFERLVGNKIKIVDVSDKSMGDLAKGFHFEWIYPK